MHPVRIIATNGVVANQTDDETTGGSTRSQFISRIPIIFGCNATEVTLAFDNYYLNGTTNVETNGTQTITIVKVALEKDGAATSTPITFSGGRTLAVAPGAVNVHSDTLTTSIVADQLYWERITATVPAPGVVGIGAFTDPLFTGAITWFYDPVNNIDQVDGVGPLTRPTTPVTKAQGYGASAILGRCPESGHRSVVNVGASFSVGFDDPYTWTGTACSPDGTAIAAGIGIMPHAAMNNGVITGTIPFTKITLGGTGATQSATWTKSQAYFQYANILFDDMGANDISAGLTPAQIMTLHTDPTTGLWTIARKAGVQRVVAMQMNQRTNSTNQWIDAAGQTPQTGFNTGQVGDQLNGLYATAQTAGTLDGQLTLSGTQDPGNRWLWKTNGTVFAFTCAGLHPIDTGYPLMGAELRTIMNGLSVN